ncbi:hypothetical protein EYF80_052090 [Liparis tanakae]|uniref:Uncharacterized protein n=1 Tax=Liparis tanakae TaxID=230148 RepID=A0A4Z2FA46_9TELE|nr:hypothetical protein EYF80_052090 [Liparis tanakae]
MNGERCYCEETIDHKAPDAVAGIISYCSGKDILFPTRLSPWPLCSFPRSPRAGNKTPGDELCRARGVPSGRPEHMCFGLPRAEPYLSPGGGEQTAGFNINKRRFTQVHHRHGEPQDVKEPPETLCEEPIDGPLSVDEEASGSIGGHYREVPAGTRGGEAMAGCNNYRLASLLVVSPLFQQSGFSLPLDMDQSRLNGVVVNLHEIKLTHSTVDGNNDLSTNTALASRLQAAPVSVRSISRVLSLRG